MGPDFASFDIIFGAIFGFLEIPLTCRLVDGVPNRKLVILVRPGIEWVYGDPRETLPHDFAEKHSEVSFVVVCGLYLDERGVRGCFQFSLFILHPMVQFTDLCLEQGQLLLCLLGP